MLDIFKGLGKSFERKVAQNIRQPEAVQQKPPQEHTSIHQLTETVEPPEINGVPVVLDAVPYYRLVDWGEPLGSKYTRPEGEQLEPQQFVEMRMVARVAADIHKTFVAEREEAIKNLLSEPDSQYSWNPRMRKGLDRNALVAEVLEDDAGTLYPRLEPTFWGISPYEGRSNLSDNPMKVDVVQPARGGKKEIYTYEIGKLKEGALTSVFDFSMADDYDYGQGVPSDLSG